MLIPSTLATGAAVLMCALSPVLGASAVKGAELDVDLTNASGTPVLSLVGSVSNATGRGYATSAPLHGAGAMHMMRGENFVLRRRADGTINAYGGLGSRLTIHVTPSARYAEATGTIARRTRCPTGTRMPRTPACSCRWPGSCRTAESPARRAR